MNVSIVIVVLCAGALSSGEAHFWNPIPVYQQGSQFNLPGQFTYNYQPGVPLPLNVQQLGAQSVVQQQPGQFPFNYQPGINIQQLTQTGSTSALQPTNIQGIPISNQQVFQPSIVQQPSIPFGIQQNGGIPINTFQQTSFPVNQQFIPQIGGAPGPIQFPQ